jgi:hypothetical protein
MYKSLWFSSSYYFSIASILAKGVPQQIDSIALGCWASWSQQLYCMAFLSVMFGKCLFTALKARFPNSSFGFCLLKGSHLTITQSFHVGGKLLFHKHTISAPNEKLLSSICVRKTFVFKKTMLVPRCFDVHIVYNGVREGSSTVKLSF